jgi:hypothetical protein
MEIRKWHNEKTIQRAVKSLESNFFDAAFFSDRETLMNKVLSYVKPKMKIGFGGSLTVRDLGIVERLKNEDVVVLDHWKPGLSKEEIDEIRSQQLTCDLFFSSANAITEKGEIINIDGFGNRTNSTTYGPKKVIIIAGYNKIVPDMNAGIERIKNVAAPMNARRLNLSLPCAETGRCHDCRSEARICRIISIMQRKPGGTDISVYLINEELGL